MIFAIEAFRRQKETNTEYLAQGSLEVCGLWSQISWVQIPDAVWGKFTFCTSVFSSAKLGGHLFIYWSYF